MPLCKTTNCSAIYKTIAALALLMLTAQPVEAGNLVDDFTEISGSVSYPVTNTFGGTNGFHVDAPLNSTFGVSRVLNIAPGPQIPPPNPLPTDLSLTVDIDPNLGQLTANASAEATTFFVIGWVVDPNEPVPDVTGDTHIAIDYSASVDYDLIATFSNLDAGGNPEAGSRATLVLPAATNQRLLIPFTDINEDIPDALNPPNVFPPADLSALDGILLDFQTSTLGAELTLTQVALINIPEPASLALVGLGLLFTSVKRRRTAGNVVL